MYYHWIIGVINENSVYPESVRENVKIRIENVIKCFFSAGVEAAVFDTRTIFEQQDALWAFK